MRWPLDVLNDEQRAEFMAVATVRRHRRRSPVFLEGDVADGMYIIVSGHVAVQCTLPAGESGTLVVLGPGDVFGELALVSPGRRNAAVVTLSATTLLKVSSAALDGVRERVDAIDRVLMEALAMEVRRLSALLMEALYLPAEDRIIRRVAELASVFAADEATTEIVVPLTQTDIAQMAGTTRPTVSRVLGSAEAAGELRVERGRLHIINVGALRTRAARAVGDH